MDTLKSSVSWINDLLPEGLPIKTSTVITGPGGSGKPLIGETFVSEWLKKGGSIAFMSLQYPNADFISESLKQITGLDLNDYSKQIIFYQLDVNIESIVEKDSLNICTNLVKPEVWDTCLQIAKKRLPNKGPGLLVFSSAINLLLFSPTYGEKVLEKIIDIIENDKSITYLLSVSTTAKKEEISKLEKAADNLFISNSTKPPLKLFMRIKRVKGIPFLDKEIQIPIKPGVLNHIKGIAEHSRSKVIPEISKI